MTFEATSLVQFCLASRLFDVALWEPNHILKLLLTFSSHLPQNS